MSKIGIDNSCSTEDESVGTLKLSEEEMTCKKRVPKRVLHFSDGTLEEYSSDEDSSDSSTGPRSGPVLEANLAHINWLPWFWYQTAFVGSKALAVCDYFGEILANFFGITSPKYEYEIEQYKRAIAEEEERRKQDAELGSLSSKISPSHVPVQTEPSRF